MRLHLYDFIEFFIWVVQISLNSPNHHFRVDSDASNISPLFAANSQQSLFCQTKTVNRIIKLNQRLDVGLAVELIQQNKHYFFIFEIQKYVFSETETRISNPDVQVQVDSQDCLADS